MSKTYDLTEIQIEFMLMIFYASNYAEDLDRALNADEHELIALRAYDFAHEEDIMNMMLMITDKTTDEDIKRMAETLIN